MRFFSLGNLDRVIFKPHSDVQRPKRDVWISNYPLEGLSLFQVLKGKRVLIMAVWILLCIDRVDIPLFNHIFNFCKSYYLGKKIWSFWGVNLGVLDVGRSKIIDRFLSIRTISFDLSSVRKKNASEGSEVKTLLEPGW